jgi:hypothetical protein
MEEFKIILPKHPSEEGYVDIDISKWLGTDTIKSVTYTAKTLKGEDSTSVVLDNTLGTYIGHHLRPYIKSGANKVSYKLLALVECNEVDDVGAFSVEFAVKIN